MICGRNELRRTIRIPGCEVCGRRLARALAVVGGRWLFSCCNHGERHGIELDAVQSGGCELLAALVGAALPDGEWGRCILKLGELKQGPAVVGDIGPLPAWTHAPLCEVCSREPASIFTRWHGRWQFSCGGHGEEPTMMIDSVLAGGGESLDELAHWNAEGVDWSEFAAMLRRMHMMLVEKKD